jgi:hypothetical protein
MERHRRRIGVWRCPVEDRRQNLRFKQGQDVEPFAGGLAKATIIEIVAVVVALVRNAGTPCSLDIKKPACAGFFPQPPGAHVSQDAGLVVSWVAL